MVVVHPVDETQPGCHSPLLADRDGPDVPLPVLGTTKHRVLYADEWLIHLLCHTGTGGEQNTPLMHSGHP